VIGSCRCQPEGGVGEKAYKRVLRTFKSAEKMPIMGSFPTVYCTDKQAFWGGIPFFEDKEGWVTAESLDYTVGGPVLTLNKGLVSPSYAPDKLKDRFSVGGLYLIQTTEPGLALHITDYVDKHADISVMSFDLIDFRTGEPLAVYSDDDYSLLGYESRHAIKKMKKNGLTEIPHTIILNGESDIKNILYYSELISFIIKARAFDVSAYKDYVYNIEVEDYHTYFVDEIGFWVQSSF
jgi:hypothetical protein